MKLDLNNYLKICKIHLQLRSPIHCNIPQSEISHQPLSMSPQIIQIFTHEYRHKTLLYSM